MREHFMILKECTEILRLLSRMETTIGAAIVPPGIADAVHLNDTMPLSFEVAV